MLNILDQKRKNINNSNSLVSKQSSIVVLRKNKFKARIGNNIIYIHIYKYINNRLIIMCKVKY